MFSIFTYIMSRVTHSEPGLPMFWFKVQTLAVWKKTTTHDAMFVWMMVPKLTFPHPLLNMQLKNQNI